MERGLYIAAAGMAAERVRQDLVTNDLANVSTPGYKQDRAVQRSFGEVLLAAGNGTIGSRPEIEAAVADLSQGSLRDTGQPLDFAILGDGFFAVRTPAGVRYTRNGQFSAGDDGTLVDAAGRQVLGANNQPIKVVGGKVDPKAVGVVTLREPRKDGDGLWAGAPGGRSTATVRQGTLEQSGVDPTRATVDMVTSLRAFEAGQKAIHAIDSVLERAATQIGAI